MTQATMQSVQMERTRADYLKLCHILTTAQNIQTYRLTAWIVSAVAVGTLHEWLSDLPWVQKHIFYEYGAFYMGTMVALFFLVLNLVYRIFTRNIPYVQPGQNFMRQQRFEIDALGVSDTSDVGKMFMSWKGVTNILRTREYLLFYFDSMSAHIIPVRSFASPAAADEFYRLARDCWKAVTENEVETA